MAEQITVCIATAAETWGDGVRESEVEGLTDRYEDLIREELASRWPQAEIEVVRQPHNLPGQRVRVFPEDEDTQAGIIALLDDLFTDERVWNER